MLSLVAKFQSRAGVIRGDESGQDAFEYMLVIGVVMVAVIAAVAAGFKPGTLVTDLFTKITGAIDKLFP